MPAATAIRMRASSEHDPEKWEPVFGKGSCSTKELVERFQNSNHMGPSECPHFAVTSPKTATDKNHGIDRLVYPLNASTLPSPGRNSGLPDLRGTTAEPGQAWLPSEGAS